MKEALQDLGFYEPDARAGETPEELNQYPNQNLFNAINKFQREHNLSERGVVAPGYQTEAKINNELKKQTKTPQGEFKYDGATFDGKTLAVYDAGEKVAEFAGVSGKPGYQSSQYQNKTLCPTKQEKFKQKNRI